MSEKLSNESLRVGHIPHDTDFIYVLPNELGGGKIIESDYEPDANLLFCMDWLFSNDTPKDAMSAPVGSISSRLRLSRPFGSTTSSFSNMEKPYSDEDIIRGTISDATPLHRYTLAEMVRLCRPIAEIVERKKACDMRLTKSESIFDKRYTVVVKDMKLMDYDDRQEFRKPFNVAVRTEAVEAQSRLFEKVKREKVLHERGAKMSESVRVLKAPELSDAYKQSLLGTIALLLMDGETIKEEEVDAFVGVAAMDVMPYATDLHDRKVLNEYALKGIGAESMKAAWPNRLMQGAVAHPRNTTGDGQEITTRDKPGV